ncbi:AMP-dependent synthetase/ligase [Anaerovorax odorimutans]|uniref:AMP-dependent synthetase/ligase n=1 Tax=Anaerovorax odorimutans TaxID=109327 RepID=UPI0003F528E6|nr:AMP-binding protein [Anaerovorax odorimutans]
MSNLSKENDYEIRIVTSLKDMLNSSVDLYSNRSAFLVKKEKGGKYIEKSYKQFKEDVDALGTKLLEMGLKDSKIAVIGENCYSWIVTYFATVNGTGVIVPLDKELSQDEIYNLINTAKCDAVFYTNGYEKYFKDLDIKYKISMKVYENMPDDTEGLKWHELIEEGNKLIKEGDRSYIDTQIDAEELRILLFTSGTTGAAKAVMLNHRNLVSNIMDTCKIVEIFPEDRTLSILPIHHTFESTMGMMLVIYRGASTAFCEGLKYVSKNLIESQATVLIGVPLIFEAMYDKIWKQAIKSGKADTLKKAIKFNKTLKAIGFDMSKRFFKSIYANFGGKLRLLITGAAGIDPNVFRGFEDLGFRILQGYGLTECSPLVSGTPFYGNTYKKAGSVGPAIRHGEIKIVNKDESGIGEIAFKGPNVMIGYYNMPEETAKVLKDGWFYTGDLGFVDSEGWLYITGRKKNVIVTKTGKNIYPEEVESYVNKNKYVEECMIYGSLDDNEDTLVSVQIIPNYEAIFEEFGKSFDDDEIYCLLKEEISEINQKFPIYKRIRNVIIRKDNFIKTTTKKIKRHKNI